MTYNFDDYLNTVRQNIKNKKLHAPICAELESHLQDSADFYVEIGYDEETANKKALEDMGEPATVGESMAKLHKLSGWQRFLLVIFFFVAILKVFDLLLVNGVALGAFLDGSEKFSFLLSGEIVPFIVTFAAGIGLTLYTKRIAPAVVTVIISIMGITTLWSFSGIVWVSATARLEEYLSTGLKLTAIDYVVSAVFTVLIVAVITIVITCVVRTVKNPFADSRKARGFAKKLTVLLLCIFSVVYLGIFTYVDHKDKEQFELYSRVVADMCDLCMEKGRITADDFEEVKGRFDYLEIVEIDSDTYYSDYDNVYVGKIGEGLMIYTGLYLSTSSDGSFEFSVSVDRYAKSFDLSLRYFSTSRYIDFNNRWEGSDDASLYIAEYLENVQQGDTLDGYLNKVKETGSDFSYFYDADGYTYHYLAGGTLGTSYEETDYKTSDGAIECYSTHLDTSDFFGQWYFDIYADDGKFVTAAEMID